MTILLLSIFALSLIVLGFFAYPVLGEISALMKDAGGLMERVSETASSAAEIEPYVQSIQLSLQRNAAQIAETREIAMRTADQAKQLMTTVRAARQAWKTVVSMATPEMMALLLSRKERVKNLLLDRPFAFVMEKIRPGKTTSRLSALLGRIGHPFKKKRLDKRYWLIPLALLGGTVIGTAVVSRMADEGPEFYGDTY